MTEFLKDEDRENSYRILRRISRHNHTVEDEEISSLPEDGVIVGTFTIRESGYNPFDGNTYDEVLVFLYEED